VAAAVGRPIGPGVEPRNEKREEGQVGCAGGMESDWLSHHRGKMEQQLRASLQNGKYLFNFQTFPNFANQFGFKTNLNFNWFLFTQIIPKAHTNIKEIMQQHEMQQTIIYNS
jgi:hypothetical protein